MIKLDVIPNIFYPGTVYMLHDMVYSKQKGDYPSNNVKTIRFDRPCIILSVSKDQNVATVIPLTTKENAHHTVYPIQIEEDRLSYAIMSQITTVETNKLMYFIGELKNHVFTDIKTQYMKYLNGEDVSRNIPVQYNLLDVYRLYPFRIYYNRNRGIYKLCLRLDNNSIIFIKVNPMYMNKVEFKRNHKNCTFIGSYMLDSYELVSPNLGYFTHSDWQDIGFEFNPVVRDTIVEKCNYLLGINVYNHFKIKEDSSAKITKTICKLYGVGEDYILGREIIDNINSSKRTLYDFTRDPITYLTNNGKITKNISNISMKELVGNVCEYVFGSMDILRAPLISLTAMQNHFPNLLAKSLSPFMDIFYDNPSGRGGQLFDGRKLHNKYTMENMTWISNFINSK